MESFFVKTPIGILTGFIKDDKLYSLSAQGLFVNETGQSSSALVEEVKTNQSSSALVKEVQDQITFFFKGQLKKFDIPLYERGTAFQKKVWKALQKIPYAETKTYSQIAQLIHKPKAYRAVGSSCGKNPFLLVIPCHRVLSQQGLGGFALGLNKKKQLLKLEQLQQTL